MSKLATFLMMMLGAIITIQAQVTLERSVIGSAGYASPTMSFTMGEVVTTTTTAGSIVLTQGFQQPDTVLRVGISNVVNTTLDIQLYPNPANYRPALFVESGAFLVNTKKAIPMHRDGLSISISRQLKSIHQTNAALNKLSEFLAAQ